MAAIVTHRFRKNNVQNIFDEMTLPKAMLSGCSSSGSTITPISGIIPGTVQKGMMVTLSSGSGSFTTSVSTIVTSVSSSTIQVSPAPTTTLSGALLSFYSQYYIGIGKSDPYAGTLDGNDASPGVPIPAAKTNVDVRNNLIALQKVLVGTISGVQALFGNAGYMVPRYNWSNGSYYKVWDSTDPSCFYPSTVTKSNGTQITVYPCYVVAGNTPKVYICVASGYDISGAASTTDPSDASLNNTVIGTVGNTGINGYRWVYVSDLNLDTTSTLASATLVGGTASMSTLTTGSVLDSNTFFRVYRNTTTVSTASKISSSTVSAGSIYSIRILNGGTGYSTGSFRIDGDGTGVASGTFTVSSGAISSMTVTTSGANYTTGIVTIVTGTGSGNAILLPRIAPVNGFGYDVVMDLPAWFAGFYGSFPYGGTLYPGVTDIPSTDTLRQVSIIRNPVVVTNTASGTGTGSATIYRCLKYLTINSGSTNVSPGDVIGAYNSTSGANARGYVDYVAVSGSTTQIYYHQNSSYVTDSTGTTNVYLTPVSFVSGASVTYTIYQKASNYTSTTSPLTISAVSGADEYTAGTGEVVFVQNRTPMIQASGENIQITAIQQF